MPIVRASTDRLSQSTDIAAPAAAAAPTSADDATPLAKDRAFWAEIVATGVVGALFYFLLDAEDIGQVAWIVGTLLIAHRHATIASIRQLVRTETDQLAQEVLKLGDRVDNLTALLDLKDHVSGVPELRQGVDAYEKITDPALLWLRDEAADEFADNLNRLQQTRRSRTLGTAEYYAWLLRKIDIAPRGSEIWAVSRMLDCEWDDSPAEDEFIKMNLSAADRGVKITRLFLCTRAVWQEAKLSVPPVVSQLEHKDIQVYFGDIDDITKRDPKILRDIGDGLIAFDQEVLLVDQHSTDGSARGYVSANAQELKSKRQYFENLKRLCLLEVA